MSVTEKQITGWKEFIKKFGALWTGTSLSGYGEEGPYHCADCEYLVGKKKNNVYRDSNGAGRCLHSIVKIDPKLKKDAKGLPIINIEHGCCEFVEPMEETSNSADTLVARK
jgi:hypothetical protein